MKGSIAFAFFAAVLILGGRSAAANPVAAVLAKFSMAWSQLKTYDCMISAHEVKGRSAQDRVYHIQFEKPLHTRMDIISGDGRGSAAVWDGGESVRGHRGGILAGIRLNVNIHSRIATTLRGTTVAQANFGSLLDHLRSLKPAYLRVTREHNRILLVAQTAYPPPDNDVTKEVYVFGPNGLPVQYYQYAGNNLVKSVVYSGLKVNVNIPASAFSL